MSNKRLFNKENNYTVYHILGKTLNDVNYFNNYSFADIHKERLKTDIIKFCEYYCFDLLDLTIMSNHFHFLIGRDKNAIKDLSLKEMAIKYSKFKGIDIKYIDARSEVIHHERRQLNDISHCMMRFRSQFTRWYNKDIGGEKPREGSLWNAPYKAIELENEGAVLACLTYVILNPARARMVDDVRNYKFCSAFSPTEQKSGYLDNHPYKNNIIKALSKMNIDNHNDEDLWNNFQEFFAIVYSLFIVTKNDDEDYTSQERDEIRDDLSAFFERCRRIKCNQGILIGIGFSQKKPKCRELLLY